MSKFEVVIKQISTPIQHPNADNLDIIQIGGYTSIVQKDTLKDGDLIAYIPEGAIVPDWILESMNLVGKLAGKKHNRVKAIRLRGIVSQGLCLPLTFRENVFEQISKTSSDVWVLPVGELGAGRVFEIGEDAAEFLGIVKYEPPIPVHMGGEVFNAFGYTPKYDVENWKKWPTVIEHGEEVVFTEKAHGTWACMGYHPHVTHPIITSKGLSDRGLAFKMNDANENNLYMRAWKSTMDADGDCVVTRYRRTNHPKNEPFYILGEIYGAGVQDLRYGADKPTFAAFDIYCGDPGSGRYLDYDDFVATCIFFEIPMVPILYRGPFSKEAMLEHTDGKETMSGTEACIREGLVINVVEERRHPLLGRVCLKSVSDAYLTRKNGTEYN